MKSKTIYIAILVTSLSPEFHLYHIDLRCLILYSHIYLGLFLNCFCFIGLSIHSPTLYTFNTWGFIICFNIWFFCFIESQLFLLVYSLQEKLPTLYWDCIKFINWLTENQYLYNVNLSYPWIEHVFSFLQVYYLSVVFFSYVLHNFC